MKKVSGKPQMMKQMNGTLLRSALMDKPDATKAELSAATGISLTTINTLFADMLARGEIEEVGFSASSGGRKAKRYRIAAQSMLSLCLCVQKGEIRYGVCNLFGKAIAEGSRPLPPQGDPVGIALDIARQAVRSGEYPLRMIGLGIRGSVIDGVVQTGVDMAPWYGRDVSALFEQECGIPCIMENDLNCMAMGFKRALVESGKGACLNLAYLHFEKDSIGAGMIENGRLIRGHHNFAGEMTLMPISDKDNLLAVLSQAESKKEYAKTVARLLGLLDCIISPEYIVLGGENFDATTLSELKVYSALGKLGEKNKNLIYASGSEEYYLSGLGYLSARSMIDESGFFVAE